MASSKSLAKTLHSEHWWLIEAPAHVVRCEGHLKRDGSQCRREAIPGATVCKQHGGVAPQVLASAAVRLQNAADRAASVMVDMIDNAQDERNRIVASKDVLDRTGFVATNKVLLGIVTDDPVERLFRDILGDPNGLADPNAVYVPSAEQIALNRAADPQALLDEDVVDAEIVEEPEAGNTSGRTNAEYRAAVAKAHYRPGRSVPKHIREAMDELL